MKKPNLLLGIAMFVLINVTALTYADASKASAQQNIELNILGLGSSQPREAGEVLAVSTDEPSAQTETSSDEKQIAEPSEKTITVVAGDTLTKIAKQHGTTYQRLFDANLSIENPDVINIGQTILIPDTNQVVDARPLPIKQAPVTPTVKAKKAKTPQPNITQTAQPTNAPAIATGSIWDSLARCESGGNWQINTGNGYYGGLQFSAATWRSVGGSGLPHQHSREEQIARAEILLARSGWGQWPSCTKKLGLR